MKFYQVFKVSLQYRWSILFTILTAIGVGVLWGANLSAVYPFMEITFKGQSMQGWIDTTIEKSEARIQELEKEKAADPESRVIAQNLSAERTTLGWYEWLRPWIYRWLPAGPLATIALLLAALLATTVLKLAFLIMNTLLVSRITNRTIYEIRNQLFDKCLQLDMAHYDNKGSAELLSRITNDVGGIANG